MNNKKEQKKQKTEWTRKDTIALCLWAGVSLASIGALIGYLLGRKTSMKEIASLKEVIKKLEGIVDAQGLENAKLGRLVQELLYRLGKKASELEIKKFR